MKELILEYLDNTFYCSAVDNVAYKCDDDSKIGSTDIESITTRTFHLNEDFAHMIVFNWLLIGGITNIKQNWDKAYMTTSTGINYMYPTTTSNGELFKYSYSE